MNYSETTFSATFVILFALFAVIWIISTWKIFEKAGEPGWACIVPFYNLWVWCKVAGLPGWAFIGFLIPYVSAVMGLIVTILMAKNFGKGIGFMLGLIFLPFIFFLILAFGDSEYTGGLPQSQPYQPQDQF
ncbi:MAG: DUF5684 domain-containing protein [Sedimentisphaeraceae bacterium JB056]